MASSSLTPHERPPSASLCWLKEAIKLIGRAPIQHGLLYAGTLLAAYGASWLVESSATAQPLRFVLAQVAILVIFCVYLFAAIAAAARSDYRQRKRANGRAQVSELTQAVGYTIGAWVFIAAMAVACLIIVIDVLHIDPATLATTFGVYSRSTFDECVQRLSNATMSFLLWSILLNAWFRVCLVMFTPADNTQAHILSHTATRCNFSPIMTMYAIVTLVNLIPDIQLLASALLPALLYVAFRDIFLKQSQNESKKSRQEQSAMEPVLVGGDR
jgi:hypothetical protein